MSIAQELPTRFPSIFDLVLKTLDPESMFNCFLTCPEWQNYIIKEDLLFKKVVRRIFFQRVICHPKMKLMKSVLKNIRNNDDEMAKFCQILVEFNKEEMLFNWTAEGSFAQLVYGNEKRLNFFWPYVGGKNPSLAMGSLTILHLLAIKGDANIYKILSGRLKLYNPKICLHPSKCYCDGIQKRTPRDIAFRNKHMDIVKYIDEMNKADDNKGEP